MSKVVLVYSGGLDTSVAVAWLREQHSAEVITLTVDLGGGSLREGVAERAISSGATRAYVVDARQRFVEDIDGALARSDVVGGTAPHRVRVELEMAATRLGLAVS